ncbi:hypothetical protein L5515_015699 [Caenorhabditis briggsae]|uniref:MSL3 chromodomain-like domain-containing protein n=1 Tax=Caenorhabditis briggsae TaxID=6238 RepID=A0AAE9EFU5_CAEBR|nr:hypothetical protein L5515_015699 [Caenorhabditis briggsae]
MSQLIPKFSKGENVVCVSKGTPYKAKVINITTKHGAECYIVHFDGWNSRYDVAIEIGSENGELFKGTVEEYQAKMGGASIPSTSGVAVAKATKTTKTAETTKVPKTSKTTIFKKKSAKKVQKVVANKAEQSDGSDEF